MSRDEILHEIRGVMADVFDLDLTADDVTADTTANDIEEWDSLSHTRLIVAVERSCWRRPDPARHVVQVRLVDRFGDNGIIAVMIADKRPDAWEIDTWLMSCRVLGRRVEEACPRRLVAAARGPGARALIGRYIPSPKNGMVRDHYQKLGLLRGERVRGLDDVAPRPRLLCVADAGNDGRGQGPEQGEPRSMTGLKDSSLASILQDRPATRAVTEIALAAWPEHDKFLLGAFVSARRRCSRSARRWPPRSSS